MKTQKPNCYDCKYRHPLTFYAHSECKHPTITEGDRILSPFATMAGLSAPAMKRLNVSGDQHGIKKGWFMWPLNFDPVWLETCDGFEKEGGEEHESKQSQ